MCNGDFVKLALSICIFFLKKIDAEEVEVEIEWKEGEDLEVIQEVEVQKVDLELLEEEIQEKN